MIKNIIKRVIVGVLIAVILGFLNSCKVRAAEYITPNYCLRGSSYTAVNCSTQNTVIGQVTGADLGANANDNLFSFRINYTGEGKQYVSGIALIQYMTPPGQSNSLATAPIIYFNNASCDITHTYTQQWGSYGTYDIMGAIYSYSCPYVDIISGNQNYLSVRTDVAVRGVFTTQVAITPMYNSVDISNTNAKLDAIWSQNAWTNTQLQESNQNIQQNTQAVEDVNDTLNDDSVDDPTDYSSNVATNGVITNLITLPITLYQKILNSTSASCSPITLGSLYGENLTMPCINLSNYLGSTLYNVIDILISGFFIYKISRKMVKVFNSLSSMKEGDVIDG